MSTSTSLSRNLLRAQKKLAPSVARGPADEYPERVVQFGEGNFLRAFADWMIDEVNSQQLFRSNVLVAQPIRQGMASELNAQDGIYTLLMRGVQNGKVVEARRIVTATRRAVNPYEQWSDLVNAFRGNDIRFVLSNTTEAGIAYVAETYSQGVCPESFPAKVASLLFERFNAVNGDPKKGLIFLPCELIDRNGDNLRRIVLEHAQKWALPAAFTTWIKEANYFLNTLVDRIVPGYPRAEVEQLRKDLGYDDKLIVAAEYFHLWVIEGPKHLADELPFTKAGLNVVWTDDLTPYRTRKVRVLNGAHTSSVLGAYLAGLDTVRDMVEDVTFGAFVRRAVFDEILPTVALPEAEKRAYAESVLERFRNPFVRHELLSISLNSVSKWKVRVLPSLLDYQKAKGKLPVALSFSLAALIAFYRGTQVTTNELQGHRDGKAYPIRDDAAVLAHFSAAWRKAELTKNWQELATTTLAHAEFWGQDLNQVAGLTTLVARSLETIATQGARAAVTAALKS
ncbi:tagaturonate reductase [Opitutus sp. ER46]|uniref:tagaturonate reductase n=1 Tax=Opitutus sp. ER46 TaxID=2161864 RepID=UPI000D30E9D3|nr:tagaturonate reductase [Opitutus sp. ER46]PTX97893.1 tagaturonate reductase [Opitutus sp. ER46]